MLFQDYFENKIGFLALREKSLGLIPATYWRGDHLRSSQIDALLRGWLRRPFRYEEAIDSKDSDSPSSTLLY